MKKIVTDFVSKSIYRLFGTESLKLLGDALRLIPRNRRYKLVKIVIIQASLSVLDLVGIALIGLIGALSVSGIKSASPSSGVNKVLIALGIENQLFQNQIAILGSCAAFFLIVKTFFSAYINRRILKFLSTNTAILSSKLYKDLLNTPPMMLDGTSSQRNLYAITQGVQSLNVGAVGSFMNVISEGFLFLTLAVGLLIYDSILAIGTISLFGLGAVILYFTLHKRARQIGIEYSDLIVDANDIFIESRGAFREILVRNQLKIYWEKFRKKKEDLASNVAEAAFMPLVSKYALEVSLILGALLVAALQFSRGSAEQAAASLGVFFATSSRLAPSILRMQQSLISMKIALYESAATFDFIIQLNSTMKSELFEEKESRLSTNQSGEAFQGSVSVNSVTAYYENSKVPALKNVSFSVQKGSFTAIVGPSGAGKSTLADCILGIMTPTEGEVTLSGIPSIQAIRKWPGKIAYVPQEPYLTNRTIRENVTFNLDYTESLKDQVKTALSESNSLEFVNQLPEDIDTNIGERGSQLSGGQRQRIGIARALYPKPELLVLDEATSALDSVSEGLITETFTKSKGKCTLIVIAHRLSTVRMADQLIYIESGEVKEIGTFEDLYSKNPRFAAQVNAMNTQQS